MHKKYIEYVEKQHTPENLLNNTLDNMNATQNTFSQVHSHKPKQLFYTGILAAACICVIFFLSTTMLKNSSFTYYNIATTESSLRLGPSSPERKNLTLAEYDAKLGTNLCSYKTIADFTLTDATAFVTYTTELSSPNTNTNKTIKDDFCKLVFEKNDEQSFTLNISTNKNIAPSFIRSTKPSQYAQHNIYLAHNSQIKTYFAAFDKNNIHYYIEAKNVSKKNMNQIWQALLK